MSSVDKLIDSVIEGQDPSEFMEGRLIILGDRKGSISVWMAFYPIAAKKSITLMTTDVFVNVNGSLYFSLRDNPHGSLEWLNDVMDEASNWDSTYQLSLPIGPIIKGKGEFLGYKDQFIIKKISMRDMKRILDYAGIAYI